MAVLKIVRNVTIKATPEACFNFWNDPTNFKRTFDVVSEVVPEGDNRSRWTLNLPSGKQEEVQMQRSGEFPKGLAWISLEGPITFNTGFAFMPEQDGTATSMALETEIGMGGLQGMMLPAMRPVIEQKIDEVLVRFRGAVEGS